MMTASAVAGRRRLSVTSESLTGVAASIASLPRLRFDGSVMNCHDDSQRSCRSAETVGDPRVVDRVVSVHSKLASPEVRRIDNDTR